MEKRKYNTWKQEDMDEALQKHRSGEIGFNEACRRFNIQKPTLRRHLKNLNTRTKFGRPNDMPPDMEEILAQHLMNLETRFFGLTTTEFRKLVFELAEKFQLLHPFNKEKKIAGKKWYYRFMKEHPNLSLRVPESTSMARSKGFNKERINTSLLLDKISNNEEIKSHLNVLSPVPCINTVIKKMKKGTKRTMELTSSPYKNEMEAKENMNKKKKPILDMKNLKTEKKINKNIKRRSSDETYRKNKKMKTKKSWLCQLCKEDREEDMIQCSKCKGWIHDLCAGVESKIKKYICDICVQSQ